MTGQGLFKQISTHGSRRISILTLGLFLLLVLQLATISFAQPTLTASTTDCSDVNSPYCTVVMSGIEWSTTAPTSETAIIKIDSPSQILTVTCPDFIYHSDSDDTETFGTWSIDFTTAGSLSAYPTDCIVVVAKSTTAVTSTFALAIEFTNETDPSLINDDSSLDLTTIGLFRIDTTGLAFDCATASTDGCKYTFTRWFLALDSTKYAISFPSITAITPLGGSTNPPGCTVTDGSVTVPDVAINTLPTPSASANGIYNFQSTPPTTASNPITLTNTAEHDALIFARTPIQYTCTVNFKRSLYLQTSGGGGAFEVQSLTDPTVRIATTANKSTAYPDAATDLDATGISVPVTAQITPGPDCQDGTKPTCPMTITMSLEPNAYITNMEFPSLFTSISIAQPQQVTFASTTPVGLTFGLTFTNPITAPISITFTVTGTKQSTTGTGPYYVLLSSSSNTISTISTGTNAAQLQITSTYTPPSKPFEGPLNGTIQCSLTFTCVVDLKATFASATSFSFLLQNNQILPFPTLLTDPYEYLDVISVVKISGGTNTPITLPTKTRTSSAHIYTVTTPIQANDVFRLTIIPTTGIKVDGLWTQTSLVIQSYTSGSTPTNLNQPFTISFNITPPFTIKEAVPGNCADTSHTHCQYKIEANKSLPQYATLKPILFSSIDNVNYANGATQISCMDPTSSLTYSTSNGVYTPKTILLTDFSQVCYITFAKSTSSSGQVIFEMPGASQTFVISNSLVIFPVETAENGLYCGGSLMELKQGDPCLVNIPFGPLLLNNPTSLAGKTYKSSTAIDESWKDFFDGQTAGSTTTLPCTIPGDNGDVVVFEFKFVATSPYSYQLGFPMTMPSLTGSTSCDITWNIDDITLFSEFLPSVKVIFEDPSFPKITTAEGSHYATTWALPGFYTGSPFVAESIPLDPNQADKLTTDYTLTFSQGLWSLLQPVVSGTSSPACAIVNIFITETYECKTAGGDVLAKLRPSTGSSGQAILTKEVEAAPAAPIVCTFAAFPVDGLGPTAATAVYSVRLISADDTLIVPVQANLPYRIPSFQFTQLSSCVGVPYCSIQVSFYEAYDSATIPDDNHFDFESGITYECRNRDDLYAVLEFTPVDDEVDPPAAAYLTLTTTDAARNFQYEYNPNEATAKFLTCILSLPVPKVNSKILKTIDATLTTDTNLTFTSPVTLPALSRSEMVSITPQLCRVGVSCEYRFEFGERFISTLPLFRFTAQFDGAWVRQNSNYCIFSQQGRDIVIQIIGANKYSSDSLPTCIFHVIPLTISSTATTNINVNIYQVTDYNHLNTIANVNKPIPYSDKTYYLPSTTSPKWVVTDVNILEALDLSTAENVLTTELSSNTSAAVTGATTSDTAPRALLSVAVVGETDACIGQASCTMRYTFFASNILRTVRFSNHFLIDHPTYEAECRDSSTGFVIGTLTVHPQLRYLYLRSVAETGFPQSACEIQYQIKGTRKSFPIYHQYEFIGNNLNTDDVTTTSFSKLSVSDSFALPRFSPFIVKLMNSFVQENSAQNYITLQVSTANGATAESITLNTLDITLINRAQASLGLAFDFSQVECIIPPTSELAVQPSCRAAPSPSGFALTFGLATNENTKYIILAWTQGSFNAPFQQPDWLQTVTVGYGTTFTFPSLSGITDALRDDETVVAQMDTTTTDTETASIVILTAPSNVGSLTPDPIDGFVRHSHALQATTRYNPRYWTGDASLPWQNSKSTDDQRPIYLAAGQTPAPVNLRIGIVPINSEIIFQMVYRANSGTNQPLAMEITNTAELLSLHRLQVSTPTSTCQFCLVFTVIEFDTDVRPYTVDLSLVTIQVRYTDVYNSYSQPDSKAFLRLAIKTHMSRRISSPVNAPYMQLIPSTISNSVVEYDPQITTVFNFNSAPLFMLYNHRLSVNTHFSKRSARPITTTMTTEYTEFRLESPATIDTTLVNAALPGAPTDLQLLSIPIVFRDEIKDAQYSYTFTGCSGWTIGPDANENCRMDSTGAQILCTYRYATTTLTTRPALPRFTFYPPTITYPRSHCNLKTDFTMETKQVTAISAAGEPTISWVPVTWSFTQRIVLPPVIIPQALAFPRGAILCDNDYEPTFTAASPGVYKLEIPDGFFIPAQTTTEYQIVPIDKLSASGLSVVSFIIGSSFETPTELQLKTATQISVRMTCPDDGRDISTTKWVYSYTPFTSGRGYGLEPSVSQSFSPPRGYFVMYENGRLKSNHLIQQPRTWSRVVDPQGTSPLVIYWSIHSSVNADTIVTFSPPQSYKYPVIVPNMGLSAFFSFRYPHYSIDPDDVTKTKPEVVSILSYFYVDPLDPTTVVYRFTESVDLYSTKSSTIVSYRATQLETPGAPNNPALIPELGASVEAILVAQFDAALEFKQCFGAQCTLFQYVPMKITPATTATLSFIGQFDHPVVSVLTLNSPLHVADTVVLKLSRPNDDDWIEFVPKLYDQYQGLYVVDVKPTEVTLEISRYIPANTPIPFHTQAVQPDENIPTYDNIRVGWDIVHNSGLGGGSATATSNKYPQIPSTTHTISKPLFSFELLNGLHLNSLFKFQFRLGRDWYFGQSVILSELPLSALSSSLYVTRSGHSLMLTLDSSTTVTSGWVSLIIESTSTTPIKTGTLIDIEVPTLLQTEVDIVPDLQVHSTGLGSPSLPAPPIVVAKAIKILPTYVVSLKTTSPPYPDKDVTDTTVIPHLNTRTRYPDTTACRKDNLCFLQLNLQSSGSSIPFPDGEDILTIELNFKSQTNPADNYQLASSVLAENIGVGGNTQVENYYLTGDQDTIAFTIIKREYHTDLSRVTITIERGAAEAVSSINIPVTFSKPQLNGFVDFVLTDSDNTRLDQEVVIGPLVYDTTWEQTPYFYYVNGGTFVGEQMAFGIARLGSLAHSLQFYSQTRLLDPHPRSFNFAYDLDFATDGDPDTWQDFGMEEFTSAAMMSGGTPLYRGYGSPEDVVGGATGTLVVETYFNLDSDDRHRTVNLHAALTSASSHDDSIYTFSQIVPTKPIKFNKHPWSLKTYSNRKLPPDYEGAANSQPWVRYNQTELVSTTTEVIGIQVNKKPWIRIRPRLNSVPLTQDLFNAPKITRNLILLIEQQWPTDKTLIDTTLLTLPEDWTRFWLKSTDVVTFTIPQFYDIPVGLYPCADNITLLEWNGSHFNLHFTQGLETTAFYSCTVPISALSSKMPPSADINAEITASRINISTSNNDDAHLPVSDSTQPSPFLSDTSTAEDYLRFYMPMPLLYPSYHIELSDVDIVGVPGTLTLTAENSSLMNSGDWRRILSYPLATFPLVLNPLPGRIGTECIDDQGVVVAYISIGTEIGLQFSFAGPASTFIQCSFTVTADQPLVHNGRTLSTGGTIRPFSSTSFTVPATTTVDFTSTRTAVRPTQVRRNQPEATVQGTLIKGLTARVTVTGREFSFSQPSLVEVNGIMIPALTSLSLSLGVPFTVATSTPTDTTGLTCVTLSNTPLAYITLAYSGQNTATSGPLIAPEQLSPQDTTWYADENGAKGWATRFSLTFYQGISPESTWSCSFEIIPQSDHSDRVSDANTKTGPYSTATLIRNELIYQPRVKTDFSFSQGGLVSKTMSSFSFYYNSTLLWSGTSSEQSAPEVLVGLPAPLLSFPFDGVQCWLNQLPYGRLPFSVKSTSSIDTFYTIPLERYIVPTGYELNHIKCIAPNLSTRSQAASKRGTFQFGLDLILEKFIMPFVPKTTLYQTIDGEFSSTLVDTDYSPVTIGSPTSYINLLAYQRSPLKLNMTYFETAQPVLLTTSSQYWSASTSRLCVHDFNDPETIAWEASQTALSVASIPSDNVIMVGDYSEPLTTTSMFEEEYCYMTISTDKINPPAGSQPTNCSPEVMDETTHIPCAFKTTSFTVGPYGALQVYTTNIVFKPLFRFVRHFEPLNVGTIGYVEYEFSGFHSSTSFRVKFSPENPRYLYETEIHVLDADGNDIVQPSSETRKFPAWQRQKITGQTSSPVYWDNAFRSAGSGSAVGIPSVFPDGPNQFAYDVPAGTEYQTLQTLRISYRALGYILTASALDITIDIVSSAVNQADDENYSSITYKTQKMSPIVSYNAGDAYPLPDSSALMKLGVFPWNPIVSIVPPAIVQRGQTMEYRVVMSSVSPVVSGFTMIPLLEFDFLKPTDPFSSLAVTDSSAARADWHVSSPYGTKIVEPIPDWPLTAVGSACFDHAWSSAKPLARMGIIALPNTLEGLPLMPGSVPKITTMVLSAMIMIEADSLLEYYTWLRSDAAKGRPNYNIEAVDCTFPLAFHAPAEKVKYREPTSLFPEIYSVASNNFSSFITPVDKILKLGISGDYFTDNFIWNMFWNVPNVIDDFTNMKLMVADLDANSFKMSSIGQVTFNIHGIPLVPDDVLLLQFHTNTTDSSITANPLDQGYRFFSPTGGSAPALCYNKFYPSSVHGSAELTAASSFTYRPQIGGVSNTFALTITEGSFGMFPQFVCTAQLTSANPLPFTGYITMQKFTAREYAVLTKEYISPQTSTRFDPIYPACGGILDSYEQVRWCPSLAGRLSSPVELGVDLLTQYDDVSKVSQPVSFYFTVTVSPTRQNAVLTADLSHLHLAAFYGCPGYPLASFYGELGTDKNAGVLSIPLAEVTTDDTLIQCNFLSSQHINEIYSRATTAIPDAQLSTRPTIPFNINLQLPNPENKSEYVKVFDSTIQFRSTYQHPSTAATIRIPLSRTTFLEPVTKSTQNYVYSRDPYLSPTEASSLLSWFQITIAASILPIEDNSGVVLFTKISLSDLMISQQEFDPTDATLTVDIIITKFTQADLDGVILYATPFANPEAWIASIRSYSGLSLKSAKIISALDLVPGDIKSLKYIPLANLVESGPLFTECVSSCGGNCQPCVENDPCFNSKECRYGLFCHFDQAETTLLTSETGFHQNIVVKSGLVDEAGTCRQLGYGLEAAAKEDAIRVRYSKRSSSSSTTTSTSASTQEQVVVSRNVRSKYQQQPINKIVPQSLHEQALEHVEVNHHVSNAYSPSIVTASSALLFVLCFTITFYF